MDNFDIEPTADVEKPQILNESPAESSEDLFLPKPGEARDSSSGGDTSGKSISDRHSGIEDGKPYKPHKYVSSLTSLLLCFLSAALGIIIKIKQISSSLESLSNKYKSELTKVDKISVDVYNLFFKIHLSSLNLFLKLFRGARSHSRYILRPLSACRQDPLKKPRNHLLQGFK